MRIDKFLKVARIIKRRTLASEACGAGRVLINGKKAKAGSNIMPGDIIEITFGNRITKLKVLDAREHVRKDDAGELFELLT
jgi:ribosomal 50S subunit-recycling heat shock protein